jgi:lambda family phage portal protein
MLDRVRSAVRGAMRGLALAGDGLEAGRFSRRMSNFLPARVHVNTLISASGKTALARARYLVRNNSYAAGAVECFTANLVGAGIVPSWTADEAVKIELQAAWKRWTDEADSEGLTDLYGLMRRVGRELFIAGEIFVRKRPRYLTDGLPVPLQLQLLPSEMCPLELTLDLDNGNRVRQGIEFDALGRRVAYHFWRVNPGDSTEKPAFGQMTRVPASDIRHVFDPVEAGQIRGLSMLAPAIVSLWALDVYDDAELERKKTAALFTAFVKRADPDGTLFDEEAERKAQSGDGIATVTLEAGKAQVLMPGEDISTAAPADVGSNYEAFQYRQLTRICAPWGLPYMGVTGDTVRSNYSNQRSSLIEMRRRMEAKQHGVIVYQFCRPASGWFLDAGVLAGTFDLPGFADDPRPYTDITWIPPKWAWVDPLKDVQAEAIAVDNGFKARSQVIEGQGDTREEVDRRIAADQDSLKNNNIVLRGTPTPNHQISMPPPFDENSPQPGNGSGAGAQTFNLSFAIAQKSGRKTVTLTPGRTAQGAVVANVIEHFDDEAA